MKKAYQKPEIMFEDFTLSTNIAGDCEGEFVGASRDSCGVLFSDGVSMVFVPENNGCNFHVDPNTYLHDGLCYHVPYDAGNLFNS